MTEATSAKKARLLPALGKVETLDMLASAVGYMQRAGLHISAGNANGRLVLAIDGVEMITGDDGIFFAVTSTLPAREINDLHLAPAA